MVALNDNVLMTRMFVQTDYGKYQKTKTFQGYQLINKRRIYKEAKSVTIAYDFNNAYYLRFEYKITVLNDIVMSNIVDITRS